MLRPFPIYIVILNITHFADSLPDVPLLIPVYQYWCRCTITGAAVPVLMPLYQYWCRCTTTTTTTKCRSTQQPPYYIVWRKDNARFIWATIAARKTSHLVWRDGFVKRRQHHHLPTKIRIQCWFDYNLLWVNTRNAIIQNVTISRSKIFFFCDLIFLGISVLALALFC